MKRDGALAGMNEQRREVDQILARVARLLLAKEIGAPDRLVERAQPERGELAARLLGDEEEIGGDLLRRPREALAQLGPLGRDSHRAAVEMAGAHHQAALGEEKRGSEAVLVGAEQSRDDDVAPGLEAAVHAHAHTAAQPLGDERLLRLGQPELPGRAGVLDRGERARAGAAVAAGDVHDVRQRLDDARGDDAHAGLRDQLDRDLGARVAPA